MNWTREVDDNGNTVWTAPGPFGDIDASWRLEQEIWDDRIVWVPKHTSELRDTHDGECWLNVEKAKSVIEQTHAEILTDSTDIYEGEE